MLYKVGSLKDYSFIYNPDDGSCIMSRDIAWDRELYDVNFSAAKWRMLYDFSEDLFLRKTIVQYRADLFSEDTMLRIQRSFRITMFLLPRNLADVCFKGYSGSSSDYSGGNADYAIFLDLTVGGLEFDTTWCRYKYFQELLFGKTVLSNQ